MAGINIYKDDVDYACNYLVQYLRDSGYEGSLQDGTAVYDLVIKPFAILYTLMRLESTKTSAYLSIARANKLKDYLGSEYDTAVDEILANWFVERQPGQPIKGVVRMSFTKAQEFMLLKAVDAVCTINGLSFFPVRDTVFRAQDYTAQLKVGTALAEYYVDLEVVSQENSSLIIVGGTPATPLNKNVFLTSIVATTDFTPGVSRESSESFIARTAQAITTRELITARAIKTVLLEEFPEVRDIYVAGHGAQEQLRDVVAFNTVIAHVGNKADLYVDSLLSKHTLSAVVGAGGSIPLTSALYPVLAVTKVTTTATVNGVATVTEHDFTFSFASEVLACSVQDAPVLVVGGTCPVGSTVEVTFLTCPPMQRVRDYTRAAEQRVACYDPLIKSKFPVLVNVSLAIVTDGSSFSDVSNKVSVAIASFINGIKGGGTITVSELLKHIHTSVPQVRTIRVPISISTKISDPKTSLVYTQNVTDQYVIPTGSLSEQVTWNTLKFYTDTSLITVTQG